MFKKYKPNNLYSALADKLDARMDHKIIRDRCIWRNKFQRTVMTKLHTYQMYVTALNFK